MNGYILSVLYFFSNDPKINKSIYFITRLFQKKKKGLFEWSFFQS